MLSVHVSRNPNKPRLFPAFDAWSTDTRLGWPLRARLLVIIATIIWCNPVPSASRCKTTTGRFRSLQMESGIGRGRRSSAKGIVRPISGPPVFGKGCSGGEGLPPEFRQSLWRSGLEGRSLAGSDITRLSSNSPAVPITPLSRGGDSLDRLQHYASGDSIHKRPLINHSFVAMSTLLCFWQEIRLFRVFRGFPHSAPHGSS